MCGLFVTHSNAQGGFKASLKTAEKIQLFVEN